MKKILVLGMGFLILTGGMAACAPGDTSVTPKVISMRVAYPSIPDFEDIPSLIAFEQLVAKGYAMLPIFFAQPELAAEAVSRGDAEFSAGSARTYLAAIQKGAPLKVIAEQAANSWSVLSVLDIKACQDLSGKRLAIHSEGAVSTAMLNAWLKDKCPTAKPDILIIPGSENRAAALLAGQIDASPVELADAVSIDQKAAGRFRVLTNFSKDLPWLKTTIYVVNTKFARENPKAVQDFLAAILSVHRQIADNPKFIEEQAPKYLPGLDKKVLPAIAKAHLEAKVWDVNGGMTEEGLKRSIDFWVATKSIPEGLDVKASGDFSFLDAVLKELSKR